MYPNYQEIADKLEIGKMYTLFKYGEFGFPVVAQFKLVSKTIEPYAQYQESLRIMFIPKGKRKETGIRLYGDNRLAIWEGLVNVNSEIFGLSKIGMEGMVSESIGVSFSSGYMDRALKLVEAKPLVLIDRD